MMRCKKLDDLTVAGLQSRGFTISNDGEVATLVGRMQFEIVQSAQNEKFFADVVLPDGAVFGFPMLQIDMNNLLEVEDAED